VEREGRFLWLLLLRWEVCGVWTIKFITSFSSSSWLLSWWSVSEWEWWLLVRSFRGGMKIFGGVVVVLFVSVWLLLLMVLSCCCCSFMPGEREEGLRLNSDFIFMMDDIGVLVFFLHHYFIAIFITNNWSLVCFCGSIP